MNKKYRWFSPNEGNGATTPAPNDPAPGAPIPPPAAPGAPAGEPLPSLETLQKELAEARREAAKYRTERNQEKVAREDELKAQGEYKTLYEDSRKQLEAAQVKLYAATRAAIAAKVGLPPELADRLKGDTDEELLKDAELLKGVLPIPATVTVDAAGRNVSKVTAVPDGKATGETEAQQRARLFGGGGKPPIFEAVSPVTFNFKTNPKE